MADSLIRTDTGTPLGTLANYSLNLSATPVDPRDGSGAVPNFSATITGVQGDSRVLVDTPVTLKIWPGYDDPTNGIQGTDMRGTVVSPKANGAGNSVSLDCSTIFEKLNTDQTVLPILASDVLDDSTSEAIRQMCLMAGVPEYSVEGNLLHYVSRWMSIGYMAYSDYKWRYIGPETAFKTYGTTESLTGGYANPIEVNPSQSVIFSGMFSNYQEVSEFWVRGYLTDTQQTVSYRVRRNGTSWALLEATTAGGVATKKTVTYVPAYNNGVYVSVLIKANSAADKIDVTMRFAEFDSTNQRTVYVDSTTTAITSTIRNRPLPNRIDLGYDSTLISGKTFGKPEFVAVIQSAQLQETFPRWQISINPYVSVPATAAEKAKLPDYVPGFTGNIWQKLREFCAITDLDMIFGDNTVSFRAKAAARSLSDGTFIPALPIAKSALVESTENREQAKSVEVVWRERITDADNYNVMYKADSVYSLEKGELKEETVQTDNTFVFLQQPIPVSGVPVPYTSSFGSYVVTGNDGFIVDPQWWKDNGGSITVAPTGKSGEIKISMQAPAIDTVRAPYRISEGVADRPALYITGYGLALKPSETMKVFTGNSQAAQEVGVTFESPFLTKKLMAMNTAHKLASVYGSGISKVTLRSSQADYIKPIDSNSPATPISDCIYWKGSYYRVSEQSVTPNAIEIRNAETFNTIAVLNGEFATGKTIADWNALHAGKTIKAVNIAPLPKYES